ncbi:MAG TPA: hypothetical protein VMV69_11385 [Pirellulales bacterium]|nr:hypothetical protein [Pirellulales bacterium]
MGCDQADWSERLNASATTIGQLEGSHNEHCFGAGTMVETRVGWKRIEQITSADEVRAKPDGDVAAPAEHL